MRHIYMYENDKKIRNILPMRKTNSKKKVYYHAMWFIHREHSRLLHIGLGVLHKCDWM